MVVRGNKAAVALAAGHKQTRPDKRRGKISCACAHIVTRPEGTRVGALNRRPRAAPPTRCLFELSTHSARKILFYLCMCGRLRSCCSPTADNVCLSIRSFGLPSRNRLRASGTTKFLHALPPNHLAHSGASSSGCNCACLATAPLRAKQKRHHRDCAGSNRRARHQ